MQLDPSSLLEMLPDELGTGIRLASLDFQGLRGEAERGRPDQLVAAKVAEAAGVSAPDFDGRWGETLDWLASLETELAGKDVRVLAAVDEVERVEDGLREGWTDGGFLDFARAAGDRLTRIRLLLVGAVRLDRLGPHWADRLVSAVQRELGYLERDQALELVRRPIPDFPDIYPPNGPEWIVEQTRGHPYLVQLVCNELCSELHAQESLRASHDDLERAVDRAFSATALFSELWASQEDAGREWLSTLARAPRAVADPDPALRRLIRDRFAETEDGVHRVAVPLFARWIRDNR